MNSGREIGPAPGGEPMPLTGNLAGVAVGVREEEESGPVPGPDVPRFLNRELSRLDFDERVLAMAEDTKVPLLERVRFLAIFSSNLDDFFQVRVAGLKEQVLAAVAVASPDGMTPLEQLRAIRLRVEGLIQRQTGIFNSEIVPALASAGITFVRGEGVTKKELSQLHSVFRQQIFPVLTPLAVDPAHPFPYISHLSRSLAVIVRDPQRHQQRCTRSRSWIGPTSRKSRGRRRHSRACRVSARRCLTCSSCCAPATCSRSIRTTHSPRRSRRLSTTRRAIPMCSPSSRRCTARR